MALDYRKCAEEIFSNLGGKENVVSAAHCATRLRLVIADNSKMNMKALEEVEGVKGVFTNAGQLQLIIGTGTVNKVYDEFLAITGLTAASKEDVKAAAAAQQPLPMRMVKALGDVFVPILPAIVASGLMMGLVEALGKIPSLGFEGTAWYAFLDMVANTAFAFLPVIVAVSASRVFGGNIFLGAVIGLMMVHGGLLNAWNAGSASGIANFFGLNIPSTALDDATLSAIAAYLNVDVSQLPAAISPHLIDAVAETVQKAIGNSNYSVWDTVVVGTDVIIPKWELFGPIGAISRVGYQGHVIPVVIAIWFMSQIEKWLHKHVPEMIDLFVTPLTTVFVTALLTFMIIGPIFSTLESAVLSFAKIIVRNPIGAMVMGAVYPATVVMGLHHMYNVIEAGMLAEFDGALNTWMPIASAANFAQFGACLAVGLKAVNNKTKVVAIPSSASAALGITEPAIFGVNMRFFKPFVCGMIGGAVGALFGAITKIGASAYGVTGIPGYLTINNPAVYTILLAVSGGIAFALTWVIWKEEDAGAKNAAAPAIPEQPAQPQKAVIACSVGEVLNPVPGKVIAHTDIPDPTFAAGVLGTGVGIWPEDGVVRAPYDGEISSVAETQHAVGITGPGDMEVLIHVGVDTVAMNGDGFTALVKEGDKVKAGQPLIQFSRDKIKAANHPDVVVVLLTNSDDYDSVTYPGVGVNA